MNGSRLALSLLAFSLLPAGPLLAQGSVTLVNGSRIEAAGHLETSVSFSTTAGTEFVLTGNVANQTISGSFTFYDLTVSKSSTTDKAVLESDITIVNTLTLTTGDIDLNGHTIDLGAGGTLSETAGSTVMGTSGVITATRKLIAPASENVAGLGAILSSAANLGVTTVSRGHGPSTIGVDQSITRYYDIVPSVNTGLNTTLVFRYDESELNGYPEANLMLYHSTDEGNSWTPRNGTVDVAANQIELTGLDALSRWTAAATDILVDPTIMMEGPYNTGTGLLATNLNALGYLPTSQPYNTAPWNYPGTESVPTTDANTNGRVDFFETNVSIVDWVLVELLSGDPASPPMTVEDRRAAFLLSDGSIVDLDGTSQVRFSGMPLNSYYVVVTHRNHIPVMTAATLDFTPGSVSYDFDATMNAAYSSGGDPMADMSGSGSGPYALYPADANGDGRVSAADFQLYWRVQNGSAPGYLLGDFNLDGQVTASDFQNYWRVNNGQAQSQVPQH